MTAYVTAYVIICAVSFAIGYALRGAWERQRDRIARLEWALAVYSQRTGHADAVEEILTGQVEARTPQGRAVR